MSSLLSTLRRFAPKEPRPHRILRGALRGCRLVTSWRDYPSAILGRTEAAVLSWFEKNVKPGETWLDIGANYGYTSIALCRLVGAEGRVFSFEPKLSTAGCLAQTLSLNGFAQATVVPVALGDTAQVEPRRFGTVGSMIDSRLPAGELAETGFVANFGWLWPRLCGSKTRFDGVKIDVQGMELSVLRGMETWLRQWKPRLSIELHEGTSREETHRILAGCGYNVPGTPVEPRDADGAYLPNHTYTFEPVAAVREAGVSAR